MLLPSGAGLHGGRRGPSPFRGARPIGALLHHEVQTYGWPWPGMLLVFVAVLVCGSVTIPFGFGMWQQLVLGQPWGDRPIPDFAFMVVGPLAILLSLLPFGVLFARLLVEVRSDGLLIQLVHFKRPRVIRPDEIRGAALARIGPLGWGESRTLRKTIYRMAGSEGVEIELTSGKKVVIGSERPRTLLDAVHAMTNGPDPR